MDIQTSKVPHPRQRLEPSVRVGRRFCLSSWFNHIYEAVGSPWAKFDIHRWWHTPRADSNTGWLDVAELGHLRLLKRHRLWEQVLLKDIMGASRARAPAIADAHLAAPSSSGEPDAAPPVALQ